MGNYYLAPNKLLPQFVGLCERQHPAPNQREFAGVEVAPICSRFGDNKKDKILMVTVQASAGFPTLSKVSDTEKY
jgi:hypothetical protein